ncbi:hypothetical protein ACK312_17760 [Aeromonas caviae]
MSIVKNKSSLQKRIGRFFDYKKNERYSAVDFLISISKKHKVYIFGGMIRDIATLGLSAFKSDIDLVVDASRDEIYSFLISHNPESLTKNKFGGFRVHLGLWDIDIWSIRDTWAIKNDMITYTGIESILNTTLMSWDSILYDVQDKKVICGEKYFSDLIRGRLELVLSKNPNSLGSIVRIFRTIIGKHADILGYKICDYISYSLSVFSESDIISYEKNNYRSIFITKERIDLIKWKIESKSFKKSPDEDLFIGDLSLSPRQLDFWKDKY